MTHWFVVATLSAMTAFELTGVVINEKALARLFCLCAATTIGAALTVVLTGGA